MNVNLSLVINNIGILIQIAEFETSDWLSEKVKFSPETQWQVDKTETGATLIFAYPGGGKVSLNLNRGELKQMMASLEQTYAKNNFLYYTTSQPR